MTIHHAGRHNLDLSDERVELGLVTVIWIISAISAAVLIYESIFI